MISMKKTPLKKKNCNLKKTPLKSTSNTLRKTYSLKKTISLQNKGTELKKQNDKSKEKWEQVRNQILERDNHKCVVCKKLGTQIHHIHLRSKRKDLLYEVNNLVCLCDKHHDHLGTDGLDRVNTRIALAKGISLEELLEFAEIKTEGQ